MKTTSGIKMNKTLLRIFKRAEAFADSPTLLDAFKKALNDFKLQEKAIKDPQAYLKSQSVDVPKGLSVTFLRKAAPIRPVPDYDFFTIQFFNCKKVWIKGDGIVEVCFGFRVVPHPSPGGPIARI